LLSAGRLDLAAEIMVTAHLFDKAAKHGDSGIIPA
jgi:hypothetical protein